MRISLSQKAALCVGALLVLYSLFAVFYEATIGFPNESVLGWFTFFSFILSSGVLIFLIVLALAIVGFGIVVGMSGREAFGCLLLLTGLGSLVGTACLGSWLHIPEICHGTYMPGQALFFGAMGGVLLLVAWPPKKEELR